MWAATLVQLGAMLQDPVVDCAVIYRQDALRHHFFQVPIEWALLNKSMISTPLPPNSGELLLAVP